MNDEDDMEPYAVNSRLSAVADNKGDDGESDMSPMGAAREMSPPPNKLKGGMPQTQDALDKLGAGKPYGCNR